MPPIAISKAAWDGYDSVEELEKLIRADQLDMSETTTGEFKIVMFDISERVKRIPKFTEGLPEKWAGRPNFKAFKVRSFINSSGQILMMISQQPKANKGAGDPIGTKGVGGIVAPRPEITFFESNVPDFGMGDGKL